MALSSDFFSKGCPVNRLEEIEFIPWGIPIEKVVEYGVSIITRWERWEENLRVRYTRISWRPMTLPQLPSLTAAELQYHQSSADHREPMLFNAIEYYFNNRNTIVDELTYYYGAPNIKPRVFLDKGGIEIGYDQKIWYDSINIQITLNPASPLIVSLHEGLQKKS